MIQVIVAIRDAKVEAWMSPLIFQSKAQALRSFSDAINDASTEFHKHPEDYSLWYFGTFDPSSGKLDAEPVPGPLGLATNFLHLEA